MDYINNKGEKIGSLDTAISNNKSVTINRLDDVTTVTIRDRNTVKVTSETFFGDSPFGKQVARHGKWAWDWKVDCKDRRRVQLRELRIKDE
jgi:hypothetical protein